MNPRLLGPTELQLNQWVSVDGRVFRIINLRGIGIAGRLVELLGHPPKYVGLGETLNAFDVAPPLAESEAFAEPGRSRPAYPKRRRAAPGAGRNAPGRRGG